MTPTHNRRGRNKLPYFGKDSVTNDLYLSPAPGSGADLFARQSTEAGAVPGLDFAGSVLARPVLAGDGFAEDAGSGGLTEAQAVSPPCTEMPPRAGDVLLVVGLFIAVRGVPWNCCCAPTRTGLAVRS
jgi:hypothetical protein